MRLCNQCCCGKAMVLQNLCVFVDLGIQNEMSMNHSHLWPVPLYNIFPHYLINGTIFEKNKKLLNVKCFHFLYKFLWNIFHSKKNWASYDQICIGLHVKNPLVLCDFNDIWIFRQIFEKYSNIKFYENPSSVSRVVPCGRMDGRTDMTKLTVAFRNFANAPKN